MLSLIDTLAELLLLFQWKAGDLQAGLAAAPFIPGCTVVALDEQEMACFIPAIGMGIGRAPALMATGDDLRADALPEPVVEYKVLALEFVLQPLVLYRICIMNDPALQVIYMLEPLMKQVGAGLLAPDASRTVHDDILVFVVLHHIRRHGELFPESIGGDLYGILKMAYFIFVVVAHVDDDRP